MLIAQLEQFQRRKVRTVEFDLLEFGFGLRRGGQLEHDGRRPSIADHFRFQQAGWIGLNGPWRGQVLEEFSVWW